MSESQTKYGEYTLTQLREHCDVTLSPTEVVAKFTIPDKRRSLNVFIQDKPFAPSPQHSFDADFVRWVNNMTDALNGRVNPEFDNYGQSTIGGIAGNWNRLRTVPGSAMTPAGYTLLNNVAKRDELKLTPPTGEHERLLRTVVRLYTEAYVEKPLPIRAVSNTSIPLFSSDVALKQSLCVSLAKSADDTWRVLREGLFDDDHARNHHMLGVIKRGYRAQDDEPGKVRVVNDALFAVSGGLAGKRIEANKTPSYDVTADGWSKRRIRSIMAYNYAVNIPFAMIDQGFKAHFFMKHHYAMIHRGREHIREKINSWLRARSEEGFFPSDYIVIATDFSEFDSTQPLVLEKLRDAVRAESLTDGAEAAYETLRSCALYDTPCGEGFAGLLYGNPFNVRYEGQHDKFARGNLSGRADVTSNNNVIGLTDILYRLQIVLDTRFEDASSITSLLSGARSDVMCLLNGDDQVVVIKRTLAAKYIAALDESLFKVGIEDGCKFNGFVITQGSDGLVDVQQDIRSLLRKFITPERAFDSPSRKKTFALGYKALWTLYNDHPLWDAVCEEANATHADVYGTGFTAWWSSVIRDTPTLGIADALYLDKPDRIYYMIDPDEVSTELLGLGSLAFDDFKPFIDYVVRAPRISVEEAKRKYNVKESSI